MANYEQGSSPNGDPNRSNDDTLSSMLPGASFDPNAQVEPYIVEPEGGDSYLDSKYDNWTGTPEIDRALLVARALAENSRPKEVPEHRSGIFRGVAKVILRLFQ